MLDIKFIRENPDIVKKDLKKRKDQEKVKWVDDLLARDEEYRENLQKAEKLRHERNKITHDIREAKKGGKDVSALLEKAKEIPQKIKDIEDKNAKIEGKIKDYLMRIPNIMHESVPYGKDDTENVEIKKWGKIEEKDFDIKNHAELMEELDVGDFERSAKISGTGFYFLKGDLALLNQALIRYAIEIMVKKGYTYIEPPLMMRRDAYEGVTSLDDFEDVMYKIEDEDLYMIATSEHPMAAMYSNEVIKEEDLPIKFTGYSMCFRREIGSHGIDTKGLFRTHQFNKVEQFVFCKPENSWEIHEELLKNSEQIVQGLEIPYRVVNICTGDLGIIASKKYDIEAWMPRQKMYREICSCSNCTGYQAKRLNIRIERKDGTREVLHTLNNTALATSRILVAILENYQNKDGSITVPKVLRPYMLGKKKIELK